MSTVPDSENESDCDMTDEDELLYLNISDDENSETRHSCQHCDKTFKRTSEVNRHVLLFHDVEGRNEVCVICGAHFVKKSQLRIHVSSQHAKDPAASGTTPEAVYAILHSCPYKCPHDNCNMAFPTEGKLKKHEKRHLDKRHICGYENCEESFAFKRELQEHVRTKHPVTNFTCHLCNKELANYNSLQQHLRLHKQKEKQADNALENVFRCEYEGCTRVYTCKKNLTQHVKSTHLSVTFDCDICEFKFKHKHTLKRHYLNIHKKTWTDPAGESNQPKTRKGTKRVKSQKEYNDERPKKRKSKQEETIFKLIGVRESNILTD